jgi:multicomponent Na+:H+ antiporter subunit F
MILSEISLLDGAGNLALTMTGLGMFLALLRLARGPSLPDRVVALDLIGILAVGFIAAYDIATEQPILLDAATVVALVGFLGTVGFAHYLQRRGRHE